MCFRLVQICKCGCEKEICRTPCVHAQATVHPAQRNSQPPPPYPVSPTDSGTNSPLSIQSTPRPGSTSPANEDPPQNFCSYFFTRKTPTSLRPCAACYLKPEYKKERDRWVSDYCATHFVTKPEDLERLTGIEAIKQRVGGYAKGGSN
ncbi:hypothetical protein DM02DRAFT_652792 [Periconia macrospinosa]|uniref:Uncharacterized protein n=1 Tax=Periconia macrospinosa TaxID=97972 RepID=A0A2V1DZ57_9PLEO|nr:hypothetical protein DM02DRAFT_652792 [Periconia macrospinosa]